MKKILILAVIAFVASTAISYAQKTVTKSFTGVKRIKMSTGSGDCEIKKASGSTVEVEVKYTYDDNRFTPKFMQTGTLLMIGEDRNGNGNYNGTVTWQVAVPDGMTFDFTTGSGNMIVSGVNIQLDANSGSGDLEFSSLKGEIDANTGSGNVDVRDFTGNAKVNTGSGDMDVTNTDGEIDLNCGSGDIKVSQAKGYFTINTGSGNINADKLTITESGKFNTGSGRARVSLAATPKGDISINSGSGTSELSFGGNEIVGEIVMRASKKHGRIIAPFEFDKTEEESNGNNNDVTIVKSVKKGNGTNRISISTGSGDAVLKQ